MEARAKFKTRKDLKFSSLYKILKPFLKENVGYVDLENNFLSHLHSCFKDQYRSLRRALDLNLKVQLILGLSLRSSDSFKFKT
jgi:hypothetical protein